mgnify:CR=1 FL=1
MIAYKIEIQESKFANIKFRDFDQSELDKILCFIFIL